MADLSSWSSLPSSEPRYETTLERSEPRAIPNVVDRLEEGLKQGAILNKQERGGYQRRSCTSNWRTKRLTLSFSLKVYEPLLVVGLDKFAGLDIRVRVSGGGHTSQI